MMLWLNGALLPADMARIDPADRGFTLGDGLFETIRVEQGVPRHLPRHLARLRAGCAVLALPCPWDDATIGTGIADLLGATGLGAAALRLTLSRGVAARGVLPQGSVSPTLLITAGPLPAALPPARMIIAQSTRRNEHSPLSRIKSLNYLDSILARQEAMREGADDALLLNGQGLIAEATAANLFALIGGRLLTPPVADGALPGIARALLLEGGMAAESSLPPPALAEAEAVFLINSLGLRAVSAIGGRPVPLEDTWLDSLSR